jgi:hypothetical protein
MTEIERHADAISPKLIEMALRQATALNKDAGVCTIVSVIDSTFFTWYSSEEFKKVHSISRAHVETILTKLGPGEIRVVEIDSYGVVRWKAVPFASTERSLKL